VILVSSLLQKKGFPIEGDKLIEYCSRIPVHLNNFDGKSLKTAWLVYAV
jgi:hypothetical protein